MPVAYFTGSGLVDDRRDNTTLEVSGSVVLLVTFIGIPPAASPFLLKRASTHVILLWL
jgi:hypothetical protein